MTKNPVRIVQLCGLNTAELAKLTGLALRDKVDRTAIGLGLPEVVGLPLDDVYRAIAVAVRWTRAVNGSPAIHPDQATQPANEFRNDITRGIGGLRLAIDRRGTIWPKSLGSPRNMSLHDSETIKLAAQIALADLDCEFAMRVLREYEGRLILVGTDRRRPFGDLILDVQDYTNADIKRFCGRLAGRIQEEPWFREVVVR